MPLAYEDKIKLLADKHFNAGGEAQFLALALGCRYVSQTQGSWRISEAERPQPVHYPLVSQTLLRLVKNHLALELRDYTDAFAFLDGLANNDAWHIFLETREDAQALSFFLLHITCWLSDIAADSEYFNTLSGQTYPALFGILNTWLGPSARCNEEMPLWKLAQLLFGEHWCDMFIDDKDPTNPWVIYNLVNTHRPCVRLDLLPAALATPALPLPAL